MTNNRMPKGITQRGSKFRVSIMVAGVRMTATCDTLVDAIQRAENIRLGVDTGQVQKVAPWTLQEACERLMAERVIPNATSAGSRRTRRSNLKQVVDFFGGEVTVDQIAYINVMHLTNHLRVKRGLAPTYTNGILVALKMLLDHAWKSGRKAEAPVKIDLVKHKEGRVRFLTKEEEEVCLAFLDRCAQDEMMDLFTILIDTGLRIGELLALEWPDVDFKALNVRVWMGKSAKPRSVAMTKRVAVILKRRKLTASTSPKVMRGHGYQHFHKTWQFMRGKIGLMDDKDFVIHALRHTCCTRLVSAGIDLRTVQRWMGHEDIKTTMRYAHFMPENLINAAAALEPSTPDLKVV